jgi:hypothetical protein
MAAEGAQKAAAKLGYEWRDTDKLIKEAKALAEKGEKDKAMSLAKKAEDQAKIAMNQYQIETQRYSKNHP